MTTASSLQRLAVLQDLATQQEDTAAKQLADALARHANAEDRRAELLRYEIEYAAQPPATAGGVKALSQQAGFLARLREAVRFQDERVQLLSNEVEQARGRWVSVHRELEKLGQLEAGALRQLQQSESRKENREQDELAARRWSQGRATI